MARALRILILEDNPNDAELMQFELKNAGFSLTSKLVSTKDAFLKGIEKFSPDVILSDYDLPQYDGALALEEAKKRCPDIPFILVTGAVSEDRAIEILTGGAWDYVLKNRLNRLAPAVQRAIGEAEEHRARKKAEAELREAHRSLESEVEKRTAELKKETQEHKITMEELRESEERFRSAFDYSVVPMAMTSVDGRIMRVNPAFSTMLGYSESELAGMHYRKITHPDDIAENEAGLAPVMIGEKRSFRMKKRYVRKGGGIVWADMSTSSVRDSREKPLYIITHAQEITKPQKAGREIPGTVPDRLVSEGWLSLAQEAAKAGTWEWDVQTNHSIWSDELWKLFGLEPGSFEPSYEKWLQTVHPDDRQGADRIVQEAAAGTELNAEWRVIDRNGAVRWLLARGRPLADSGGKLARYIGIVMDITDRKRAEEELKKNESWFRAIFEQAPVGIALTETPSGNFLAVNPKLCEIMGRSEEELRKLNFQSVTHPDDLPVSEENMKRLLEGRVRSYNLEKRYIRPNRSIVWVNLTVVAAWGVGEAPILNIGLVEDITDRKRAQEELSRRSTQLEEVNRELEAFTYSVSHDLQTPIRAMDGFIKIIQKEYGESIDDKFKERLNVVRDNAKTMTDIVHALLKLSRIGRKEMSSSMVDMKDIFEKAWNETKSAHPQRAIKFTLEDLPPAYGDRDLMRQAVSNLLANAAKFTVQRKKAVVHVGSFTEHGDPVYFVRDNGAGFDMAFSGKLFQAFQRLHSRSEYEGTGIGLSIVQRIVHRHGGKIWAAGKVGKGANFFFSLPVRKNLD